MVLLADTLIDPNYELLKVAKTWSPDFYEKLRILEDDDIDESYKAILMGLLAHFAKNTENDVIGRNKRSKAHRKPKEIKDSSKHSEGESDPGYELFLKHLKAHDKCYRLESEKDGLLVVHKYEGGVESKKECDLKLEPRREVNVALNGIHEKIPDKQDPRMLTRGFKRQHGLSDQMGGIENQYNHNPQSNLVKKARIADKVVRTDGLRNVTMHKGQTVVYEKILMTKDPRMLTRGLKRKGGPSDQTCGVENQHTHDPQSILVKKTSNIDKGEQIDRPRTVVMHKKQTAVNGKINHQKKENGRKFPRAVKLENGISNPMPRVENQQHASVTKTKSPTFGKSRNETNRAKNPVCMHESRAMAFENVPGVKNLKKQPVRNIDGKMKVKVELPIQMPCLENCFEFDPQPASAMNTKILTPKKLTNEAKNVKIESCSAGERCKVEAAKCSMTYANDESDSDVVILNEAVCVREGIFNHFVPSKRFDKSMKEDGILDIGGSSESDVFRKEVLDVLKKPYDREEYTRLAKEVREGRYLEKIPDFGKRLKLKKYRYNRRRRLAILRGFFFWLQNITREGSFKPWKDGACCAVEPTYP